MNKKLLFLLPAALLALTGCNNGGNASSGSESASESGSGSGSGSSGSESSGSESSGGGETTNYGTLEAPLTVAQALVIVKAEATVDYYSASGDKADAFTHQPVYVSGVISSLSTVSAGKYSFDLKDSLSDAEGLVGFNLALADGVAAAYQNDTVTLYGYLENFKTGGVTKYEVATFNEVTATVKARTVGVSTVSHTGENVTVSGYASQAANGTQINFTVAPATGYKVDSVKVYGETLVGSEGSYSFTLAGNAVIAVETSEEGVTVLTADKTIAELATANSWENGVQYLSFSLDSNITVTATGGTNTGKYYSSDSSWRTYRADGDTITISSGSNYTIKSVTLTVTAGVITDVTSDTAITVNASSWTSGATTTNAKITRIVVTYVAK